MASASRARLLFALLGEVPSGKRTEGSEGHQPEPMWRAHHGFYWRITVVLPRRRGMGSDGTNDSSPEGPLGQATYLALAKACLADATSRHPSLALASQSFAAYLHERIPDLQAPPKHGDDLVIACACLHEDTRALEILDQRVLDVVHEVIPRMRYHAISADELKQLLRVKLLCREAERAPRIAGYKGTGPLRAWVRVAAVRTILNQRRADQTGSSSAGELADLAEAAAQPDPRTQLLLQQHRNAFRAAVGEALKSLTPMQQRLLRQHYLRGLTLPDLASIYSLHRVTVASASPCAKHSQVGGP